MYIFHIDMDAFFASVEIVKNPSLKGKPVIVGGSPQGRGVVATCSYEARRYGIHSAMPAYAAQKLCPHAIFLEGDYASYKEFSDKIMDIFYTCTPLVEVVSIDEAYLDVSPVVDLYGGAYELGSLLKKIILQQTSLTCSVGIASNKLVAKIASSSSKPNGLLLVPSGSEADFLAPLPIGCLPGIGKKTEPLLQNIGFQYIKDIQKYSMEELIDHFGSWGYHLYRSCRGYDNRPVQWQELPPKSIGAETTFSQNISDIFLLKQELLLLCQKACSRLLRHKMRCRGLHLKLRYTDFTTVTRSHTLNQHINEFAEIAKNAYEILEMHHTPDKPLRLLGISLEKLCQGYWQPTFWD